MRTFRTKEGLHNYTHRKGARTTDTRIINLDILTDTPGLDTIKKKFKCSGEYLNAADALIEAAEALGIPIRFIAAEEIRASLRDFSHSDFVAKKVNLPAVAELVVSCPAVAMMM